MGLFEDKGTVELMDSHRVSHSGAAMRCSDEGIPSAKALNEALNDVCVESEPSASHVASNIQAAQERARSTQHAARRSE